MDADLAIRPARSEDALTVALCVRRMLEELALMGGHQPSRSDADWARIANDLTDRLEEHERCCLLAECGKSPPETVGLAQASITGLEEVFEPARILHIHALYVAPEFRRQGIGRALLNASLDWGRSVGCTQAELNVVVHNPARRLYKCMGFDTRQIEMVMDL
jgi:GNAT superfamily N-acetyltransferase